MSIEEHTDEDGCRWVSHRLLCVGDYAGASSVGEANIRHLAENRPDQVYERYASHGFKQMFLEDTDENRLLLQQLDDCVVFDEELLSEVEMEWEEEAWNLWLKHDLLKTLTDHVRECVEYWSDRELYEMYQLAMEDTNTYPIAEYSGVHVDVDRIAGAFFEIVFSAIQQQIRAVCAFFHMGGDDLDRCDFLVAADYCADQNRDDLAVYLRGEADCLEMEM